jgi:hypothetical protein
MVFGASPSSRRRSGICEQQPQISVRALERNGMLTQGFPLYNKQVSGGSSEAGYIDIQADYYTATIGFTVHGDYRKKAVKLVRRPYYFGRRHWDKPYFECPVCERRCEILYIVSAVACRSCHGLK